MAKTPLKASPPDSASVIAAYRTEAGARPDDPQLQVDLGWGLYGGGQYAEAAEQFERVLAVSPDSVDARYGLGLSCKALGGKEAAVGAFEKVVEMSQQIEDHVRGTMLRRLARGHINEMNSGDWNLEKEIWQRES